MSGAAFPGSWCPDCGQVFSTPSGGSTGMLDAPHADMRDCIRYLQQRVDAIGQSADDNAAAIRDLEEQRA